MSLAILVIGMRGQGKTTFLKKAIDGKPNYVFDVQNEYTEFNPAPHLDRSRFIQEATGYTDTYVVFEEATGFFRGSLSKDVDRMLLSARHTRNRYFFCFHYIQAVPPQIFYMMNTVVLFKTTDDLNNVKKKYPKLLPAYIELQRAKNFEKKIIQLM